jgi:hypothetical protein
MLDKNENKIPKQEIEIECKILIILLFWEIR